LLEQGAGLLEGLLGGWVVLGSEGVEGLHDFLGGGGEFEDVAVG
jgi:hypothetical protein